MEKKVILGIMLSVIILSMFGIKFNASVIEAGGTIYIRADGSIDPPTAPIQRVGNVYTFADNIYESIVVERDDIIINGNEYTVKGTGTGAGLNLTNTSNVVIKNTRVTGFEQGIYLKYSRARSHNFSGSVNNEYIASNCVRITNLPSQWTAITCCARGQLTIKNPQLKV